MNVCGWEWDMEDLNHEIHRMMIYIIYIERENNL